MAYGLTLEGGVTYTVESARKEAFEGVKYKIPVSSFKEHLRDRNFAENKAALAAGGKDLGDRFVVRFSDRGYGVVYKKDRYKEYYYDKDGNLEEFGIRTNLSLPAKAYRYTSKGEFEGVGFYVSKQEAYIYDKTGKCTAMWQGNRCYDEKGDLILKQF